MVEKQNTQSKNTTYITKAKSIIKNCSELRGKGQKPILKMGNEKKEKKNNSHILTKANKMDCEQVKRC